MSSSHAFHEIDYEAPAMAPRAKADIHHISAAKAQTVMDPRVYKIALGCWAVFMTVFWATFWISTDALFMVVVGTFYALMFFGVPYTMSRMVKDRPEPARSFFTFLREPFATLNGTMRGGEALLQVIMVPLCLSCGGIAIGYIIRAARAAQGY